MAADIEDFALLRSNGMPTYHMASCADDVDLRISHIIRGQDHLTNTFKHVLIFEALGVQPPEFAHLPLLIAPDGAKLSKRKHGPVVSVTTYRDAGFLPHAYVNFLCLLGWSPKDNREQMTREELIEAFRLEGVNRSNAVVNFTEEDPIDPKALWLNAQHIYAMPAEELAQHLLPFAQAAGLQADRSQDAAGDAADPRAHPSADRRHDCRRLLLCRRTRALRPGRADSAEGRCGDGGAGPGAGARGAFARPSSPTPVSKRRCATKPTNLKVKTGQMFLPIRVAVCGRKTAPPLFETLEVLGRETTPEADRAGHREAPIRR